jgi:hypothetical protein
MNVADIKHIGDYIEITHDNGEGFIAFLPWEIAAIHWGGSDDALVLTSRQKGFMHVVRTGERDVVTRTLLTLLNDA